MSLKNPRNLHFGRAGKHDTERYPANETVHSRKNGPIRVAPHHIVTIPDFAYPFCDVAVDFSNTHADRDAGE